MNAIEVKLLGRQAVSRAMMGNTHMASTTACLPIHAAFHQAAAPTQPSHLRGQDLLDGVGVAVRRGVHVGDDGDARLLRRRCSKDGQPREGVSSSVGACNPWVIGQCARRTRYPCWRGLHKAQRLPPPHMPPTWMAVLASASCSFSRAGAMKSVWNAPATASRTVILHA